MHEEQKEPILEEECIRNKTKGEAQTFRALSSAVVAYIIRRDRLHLAGDGQSVQLISEP